jgi:hypothetical protein
MVQFGHFPKFRSRLAHKRIHHPVQLQPIRDFLDPCVGEYPCQIPAEHLAHCDFGVPALQQQLAQRFETARRV